MVSGVADLVENDKQKDITFHIGDAGEGNGESNSSSDATRDKLGWR
jgi:hypothetical protein